MISNDGELPNESQETPNNANENQKSLEETLLLTVRDEIKEEIEKILADVQLWSDTEKLLLYLKLPGSKHRDKNKDEQDPHAIPLSTTRAEQTQAFHWIRCHLEECENNSTLPKHEVYDEYRAHCESVNAVRVLSAPDFGKIIKCVFPNVKARRLGTRGNSKYCYSGIQKKRIVKSPQLPNLVAPMPGDMNMNNAGSSCSNGDKIGDDQTLIAACDLVCEWANKLLGRVFNTLVELGRFLVGGSYVSSKSMAAFIVMSSNESSGSYSKLTLNGRKINSDEQSLISQKRKQTQQHLQRKIQQRQQHKQQQQHQLNLLLHPSTPTGKQFTPILPQTQKGNTVTLVNGLRIQTKPQQLQLSPKLNIVTNLQSPPTPCTPVIYSQTPQKTLGHLPPSTTLSPVTPSLTSPSLHSPYNTKSPKRSAPHTPRSGTITPSPISTTPRHTPNGEVTRFVFTPITNGTAEHKISVQGGDASPPMLKRPTATHPGLSNEWNSHQNKATAVLTTTPIKDTPGSPCKHPRIALKDPPSTPNRQTNSFSQPMMSPRLNKRTAINLSSLMPAMNSNQGRVTLSPRGPRTNTSRQPVARQQSLPSSCSVTPQSSPQTQALTHQPRNLTTFRPFSNTSTSDCRFQQTVAAIATPNFFDHLPSEQELQALCNQLTNGTVAVQSNRSHSVPPLPQNLVPRMNATIQPLTPQTDGRHQFVAPRMANASGLMINTSGHVDGLKQLRNRVLHGDTNNNSGAHNATNANLSAGYAAKRNLMFELDNVSSWATPTSCAFQQNKPQNILADDPLAGLNLDEIAIDASSGNFDILVDEALFGDNNTFVTSWNTPAQTVTLDSCL